MVQRGYPKEEFGPKTHLSKPIGLDKPTQLVYLNWILLPTNCCCHNKDYDLHTESPFNIFSTV